MEILVLGGTRFFGKRLVERLLAQDHTVTIATRGQAPDSFGTRVKRQTLDRCQNPEALNNLARSQPWDLVYDQICYSPNEATAACAAFQGQVGRYIHTSTASVYANPGHRTEQAFDPFTYPIRLGGRADFDYGESKRLAEAVFFQTAKFPVAAMRIPIVLGSDDYTRRLEFHIEHVQKRRPIVIANARAKTSFIHAAQAAHFLEWLGTQTLTGPINACANGSIDMTELLPLIDPNALDLMTPNGPAEDTSPFFATESTTLDTSRAQTAGFKFDDLSAWLPQLIRSSERPKE